MEKRNRGLDLDHLTFIDASEVPAIRPRFREYRKLLELIPIGKALVVSERDVNPSALKQGIRRIQEEGDFKRIRVVQRRGENGELTLYVINPSNN